MPDVDAKNRPDRHGADLEHDSFRYKSDGTVKPYRPNRKGHYYCAATNCCHPDCIVRFANTFDGKRYFIT